MCRLSQPQPLPGIVFVVCWLASGLLEMPIEAVEDIMGMGFVTPMSWSNLERHGSLILKLHTIGFSVLKMAFSGAWETCPSRLR